MRSLLALVCFSALIAAGAAQDVCPSSSTPSPENNAICLCGEGTQCVSGSAAACSVSPDDVSFFRSNCTDCQCELTAAVHQLLTPSVGTTCYLNQSCPVTWFASDTVSSVDVLLMKEGRTSGGSEKLDRVSVLAQAVDNTGSYDWTVSTSITPNSTYAIVLVVSGTSAFQRSPYFTIAEVPSGPCPRGSVSANGNYPGCQPCSQGTYANGDATGCLSCSSGFTTPGIGGANASACSLASDSQLANFIQFKNMHITGQSFVSLASITLERCAQSCLLDTTCRSFEFTPTSTKTGTCELAADNRDSALIHSFSGNENASYFERSDSIATEDTVAEAFTKKEDTYLHTETLAKTKLDVSIFACARFCIKDDRCKSFAIGKLARYGECYLYSTTSAESSSAVRQSTAQQIDLYERKDTALCRSGSTSATGTIATTCSPCARGSYSVSTTECALCAAGYVTEGTGHSSRDACEQITCPSGSTGPDAEGDCVCPTGSTCSGSLCQRSSTSVHYFDALCTDCQCSEAIQPPTIDFIFTPIANQKLYYGDTVDIRWQASNGVTYVALYLYMTSPTNPDYLNYVATIVSYTANDGAYTWTVQPITARTTYRIVILHQPISGEQRAPTHRNTAEFYIGPRPTGPCPLGEYNPSTGQHPCTLCPIGTYWADSSSCTDCPTNTTTLNPGSKSVSDCSVTSEDALFNFDKQPNMYFAGSNAAGSYIEDVDRKTVEECAQICMDDAGCKAFDSGVVGQHQEGDCFLSYDNKDTLRASDVRSISQLDLFLKQDIDTVLGAYFVKTAGSYLKGLDDGGVYVQLYSPESCAQLCLNDVCCRSFDAGTIGTSKEYDCYLSYHTQETAAGAFMTDSSAALDYYEKIVSLKVLFPRASYSDLLNTDTDIAGFATTLVEALRSLRGVARDAQIKVTVTYNEADQVLALLSLPDDSVRAAIEEAIPKKLVSVVFPPVIGDEYLAVFPGTVGSCDVGSVSQSGNKDRSCTICRANTYANNAQTICLRCPVNTFSLPGSSDPSDCVPPDTQTTRNIFNYGDNWFGHFTNVTSCRSVTGETIQCSGSLDIQVVGVSGSSVQLLATFHHGQYCNPSLGCRTESAGVAQFYLTGTTSSNSIAVTYDEWSGITDRSFVRGNIGGKVTHDDAQRVVLSGTFRDGTFQVSLECELLTELDPFTVGDRFVGKYYCDKRAVDGTKPQDGERDVYRMQLDVSEVSLDNQVVGVLSMDHYAGISLLESKTAFSPDSDCSSVEFIPTQWLSDHPSDVPARQLSGRMSDVGAELTGIVSLDSRCECSGKAPSAVGSTGTSCDDWDGSGENWCYVDKACPDATQDATYSSFYRAPCGPFTDCSTFRMTRICAVTQPECGHGYTRFNNRCYKSVTATATYDQAMMACARDGAELVSLHSSAEATFVASLVNSGSGSTDSIWVGLRANETVAEFSWDDGTPFLSSGSLLGYQNWADGFPTAGSDGGFCVAANYTVDNAWRNFACDQQKPYVCKMPSPVVNGSCECMGVADKLGHGATCDFWTKDLDYGWCYVDEHCSRSIPVPTNQSAMHIVACARDKPFTTDTPTTNQGTCNSVDPTTYTDADGTCAKCLTLDDCDADEVLIGSCTEYNTPLCLACDSSCSSCSALGADNCNTCADGRVWSMDRKLCLASCPSGQYSASMDGERVCQSCNETCATCSSADSCDSCARDSAYFLLTDAASGQATCVQNCGTDYYQNTAQQTCTMCTQCDAGTQYVTEACQGTSDTKCSDVSTCASSEYKAAEATATSDVVCKRLSTCRAGSYIAQAATATSDRICAVCAPGTFDGTGKGNSTACLPCSPGSYAADGATACTPCAPGFADLDLDPSSVCSPCPNNTFTASYNSTQCDAVTTCSAGEAEVVAPTRIRDRVCVQCTAGTFTTSFKKPCVSWTTCPSGAEPDAGAAAPSSSTDRVCTACSENTFKATEGNFMCSNQTVCMAGTFVTKDPTTTSDRKCQLCATETFSTQENADSCTQASTCTVGETFESSAPTTSTDRLCQPVTMCSATEFQATPPGVKFDRVCQNQTQCTEGETFIDTYPIFDATLGMNVSDFVCKPCSTECPVGLNQIAGCSLQNDIQCGSCTPCDTGYYMSAPCNGSLSICSQCSTTCPDGQWMSRACSQTKDIECKDHTPCKDNQFETSPPTDLVDRQCQDWKVCGKFEVTVQEPTASTDRVCGTCSVGTTYQSFDECLDVSDCEPGFYEETAPTLTSDRKCQLCSNNTFKPSTGQQPCVTVSTCEAGEFVKALPTVSSDRKCVACEVSKNLFSNVKNAAQCSSATICQPGEFVTSQLRSDADRQCMPCTSGSFTNTSNDDTCQVWRTCPVGTGSTVDPTSSSDRQCEPCEPGTYSSTDDVFACRTATVCPVGEEQIQGPTASTDRQCAPCATGFFKAEEGQDSACVPVQLCPAGEEESIAPTTSADRQCKQCAYGFFNAEVGGTCQPHSSICEAGTYESAAPTASSDRVCTPCNVDQGEFQSNSGAYSCDVLTVCSAGSYVLTQPLADQDRTCKLCAQGTFSTTENSIECTACAAGSYQDAFGQVSCKPVRECSIGTYITSNSTATSDAECTVCADGTYQDQKNQRSCKPVTECDAATQEEVALPTPASDRQCRCVAGSTYLKNGQCLPVTKCSASQVVFFEPTASTDRVCVDHASTAFTQYLFESDFNAVKGSDARRQDFTNRFRNALTKSAPQTATTPLFQISLSEGSIIAGVLVSNRTALPVIEAKAEAGNLTFYWPAVQDTMVAIPYGPCPEGFSSATGMKPGCSICPANTFTSTDATSCEPCPENTASPEGSKSFRSCISQLPPTEAPSTGGSKAGIISGAVIACIVLAAVVVFLLVFRRRSTGTGEPSQPPETNMSFFNPTYDTVGQGGKTSYPGYEDRDDPGYAELPAGPSHINPIYDDGLRLNLVDGEDGAYERVSMGSDGYREMPGASIHQSGYQDVSGVFDEENEYADGSGYQEVTGVAADESGMHVPGYQDVAGLQDSFSETSGYQEVVGLPAPVDESSGYADVFGAGSDGVYDNMQFQSEDPDYDTPMGLDLGDADESGYLHVEGADDVDV
eukprot:m.134987 g.134987  ORF g.134987 m.134987 type:complete len:3074 (+) comp13971_c1_seq1:42-9263(+)